MDWGTVRPRLRAFSRHLHAWHLQPWPSSEPPVRRAPRPSRISIAARPSISISASAPAAATIYGPASSRASWARISRASPRLSCATCRAPAAARRPAYVYNVAPRTASPLNASEQALALEQALGDTAFQFDTSKFNWIGSPELRQQDRDDMAHVGHCNARRRQEARSHDGRHRQHDLDAICPGHERPARHPLQIILGYPGGNDINLAMQRGEIDGRGSSSWATWKARDELAA